MRNSWDKVTRWAGIGNNRDDAANASSGEPMPDQMNDVTTIEAEENPISAEAETRAESPELEALRTERDQLKDRLARLQAEFDNFRKREAKDRADAREYTVGSTIEPFLGVMDNFSLALKSEGDVAQLRGGVQLILKQMDEALKGLQVVPVETIGAQFDPRIHEALGSIESVDIPDHQVVEEIRRGYKIRERLLRPALVKIAVNPAQVADA